ncbi:MAG: ABC-type transporter, periplasmic subunit family 3 [Methanomicrobiales archaeon 53_19]|uniref:hypothetical protein n=1 Tax=Methanocalculus sp. TaxID=2004547 RepID=UPI000746298A|nr:hypothetical protein [Methanocalculus sp.]KUK69168.1 MAG: ABC-type transporter, periplasmic subunit family 3 [Methanocalculus sp. 52_23]KUL03298.1 MAG: ABC-type transporter, periplasmic subunit family 3 [Methanomicrobiales archaeon 53_19]HIJ07075.1 hypothetical protein [Methanocalculus sp.]
MVAPATNIHLVGVGFRGKTDVAGTVFQDTIVKGAAKNGSWWEDSISINPADGDLFWKSTDYQLVYGSDGMEYVICNGIFKTE